MAMDVTAAALMFVGWFAALAAGAEAVQWPSMSSTHQAFAARGAVGGRSVAATCATQNSWVDTGAPPWRLLACGFAANLLVIRF